jgi:hypothetical protein
MAHPFRKTLKKQGPFTSEEMNKLMPYYQALGIHGLEPYHHENMENNQYQIIESFVKGHNMLSSIGSDRHSVGDINNPHFMFSITPDKIKLKETLKALMKSNLKN